MGSSAQEITGFVVKPIDEMDSIHHGLVKLAGAELGVESFGIQVLDVPPGFSDYPEHDHADDGQEEVYVVLRGRAEFTIDGERVTIPDGHMVRVSPGSRRTLQSGPDGARILAVGCTPGAQYTRPEAFRAAAGT
jgi:uncharacterized cupin superfamily protein